MQHTRKRAGLLKSALLGAATLGALSLAGAGVARADTLSIAYSAGGGAITQIGSSTTSGTISVSNFAIPGGLFSITSLNAAGTPDGGLVLGTYPEPKLVTQTIDASSSAGGELVLYITQQNMTTAAPSDTLQTTFTSNTQTAASNVMSDYVDTANGQFTTPVAGQLATSGTITGTGLVTKGPDYSTLAAGNPYYSMTLVYDITFSGAGDANLTINTARSVPTNTPEPGSLALLGTGLLGLGLVARRRRRKA